MTEHKPPMAPKPPTHDEARDSLHYFDEHENTLPGDLILRYIAAQEAAELDLLDQVTTNPEEYPDAKAAVIQAIRNLQSKVTELDELRVKIQEQQQALVGMTAERDDERLISQGWEARAREAEEAWRNVPPHELVLHCPACGKQHLDIGEFATRVHRKHLCENTPDGEKTGCGHVWMPLPYATKGVLEPQGQMLAEALEGYHRLDKNWEAHNEACRRPIRAAIGNNDASVGEICQAIAARASEFNQLSEAFIAEKNAHAEARVALANARGYASAEYARRRMGL